MWLRMPTLYGVIIGVMFAAGVAWGGVVGAIPSANDKCPVCGMFVSKYPDWLAFIRFKDGKGTYFDGPKDLFRYLHNLKRYAPGRQPNAVATIQVKDYYSLQMIDGRSAYFVLGSDVFGPMGKELIPFAKENAAREFLRDHRGKQVLRFNDITRQSLESLE